MCVFHLIKVRKRNCDNGTKFVHKTTFLEDIRLGTSFLQQFFVLSFLCCLVSLVYFEYLHTVHFVNAIAWGVWVSTFNNRRLNFSWTMSKLMNLFWNFVDFPHFHNDNIHIQIHVHTHTQFELHWKLGSVVYLFDIGFSKCVFGLSEHKLFWNRKTVWNYRARGVISEHNMTHSH